MICCRALDQLAEVTEISRSIAWCQHAELVRPKAAVHYSVSCCRLVVKKRRQKLEMPSSLLGYKIISARLTRILK